MRLFKVLFISILISPGFVLSQPVEPPMMYEFPYLCPGCNEEMVLSIRVASDKTSILESHSISTKPIVDPEYDDDKYLPGEMVAGPITDGKVGLIRKWVDEIGTNFVEVSDSHFLEAGDLVVVISGEEENTTFFLVRPMQGIPETGTFGVKQQPSLSAIQEMSMEELSEHSNHFQIYGMASESNLPTVVSGFKSGSVKIETVGNSAISGQINGNVMALPTADLSSTNTVSLEISFDAEMGLEGFHFTSPEARAAQRR